MPPCLIEFQEVLSNSDQEKFNAVNDPKLFLSWFVKLS